MANENNNTTKEVAAKQEQSFDDRHKKELSVGSYAKTSITQTLIPLLAMAGGAVAGYLTLGRPIKAIFPKLVKTTDLASDLVKVVRENGISDLPGVAGKIKAEFSELCQAFEKKYPSTDLASKEGIERFIHSIEDPAQMAKFRQTLGLAPADGLRTAKDWGAGLGGTAGGLVGGTAVAYNKWKEDESARLAAAEINEDVSKLELFRPSDSELVAENKRLRAMLAKEDKTVEIPQTSVSQLQHEGAVKGQPELSAQMG